MKRVFGEVELKFTQPSRLHRDLEALASSQKLHASSLLIVDLAINVDVAERFASAVRHLMQRGVKMVYVDHHPPPAGIEILGFADEVIVNTRASCSELIYHLFAEGDGHSALLAAYGAIADSFDDTEFVKSQMLKWGKGILYFESEMLSLALLGMKAVELTSVADELARGLRVGRIDLVVTRAIRNLRLDYEVQRYVEENAVIEGPIALIEEVPQRGFAGRAASYALSLITGDVGIGIASRFNREFVECSLRARGVDLTRFMPEIIREVGGSGGGHPYAYGVRVSAQKYKEFLELLKLRAMTYA